MNATFLFRLVPSLSIVRIVLASVAVFTAGRLDRYADCDTAVIGFASKLGSKLSAQRLTDAL